MIEVASPFAAARFREVVEEIVEEIALDVWTLGSEQQPCRNLR